MGRSTPEPRGNGRLEVAPGPGQHPHRRVADLFRPPRGCYAAAGLAYASMDDNGDLRARMEAQIAARRAAGAPARRLADESDPAPRRRTSPFVRLIVLIIVVVLLSLGLRSFILQPFYVPSGSMEATLHGCGGCNDDRLLVNKLSYKLHLVHRGGV